LIEIDEGGKRPQLNMIKNVNLRCPHNINLRFLFLRLFFISSKKMARVEQQKVISNKETFTLSSYNGIEIIIRDKDGYVNASRMVDKLSTKKFYKIYDNGSWKEYLAEFRCARKIEDISYELRNGYSKDLTGSYVHPKLINT
jgi:hypothetical protein